jgi:hypothetical protein
VFLPGMVSTFLLGLNNAETVLKSANAEPMASQESLSRRMGVFVTSIECGSPLDDFTIKNPSWEYVETQISSLDGIDKDGVILKADVDSCMAVICGRGDQYIVAGFLEGGRCFMMAGGVKGRSKQKIAYSGDVNAYASHHVVELKDALTAAKQFFQSGQLAQEFKWNMKKEQPH